MVGTSEPNIPYLIWGFDGGETHAESLLNLMSQCYEPCSVHLKSWWVFKFHVIFSWRPPFSGLSLFALLEGVWLILQMLLKLWSILSPLAIFALAYKKSNFILWNKNVCKGREIRVVFWWSVHQQKLCKQPPNILKPNHLILGIR